MFSSVRATIFLLLSSALCLLACSGERNKAQRIAPCPVPSITAGVNGNIESWELTTETKNVDFIRENIDSIKLVALQTTEDCLIGSISDLFLRGDTIIVADSNKSGKVFLFNSEGEFLSSIGQKGEGPGEYGSLNDVQISGDSLHITDWMRWQIVSYPFDGGEPHAISLNSFHLDKTFKLNDTTIIGANSYIPGRDFALVWLNSDGALRDSARPFLYTRPFPAGKFLSTRDNRLLYYAVDSDTIFEITPSSFVPVYTLGLHNNYYDFVDRTLDLDWPDFNKELYTNLLAPMSAFNVVEANNKWFVYYQKGPRNYLGVINKDGSTSKSYLRADVNERRLYVPFSLYDGQDDTLISYFDYVFKDQVSSSDKKLFYSLFPESESIIENYDFDNQNPLICLLKLRD